MPIARLEGSLTGTGASEPVAIEGAFNFRLSGTFVATVKLERSFDDGSSWAVVSKNIDGQEEAYTAGVDTWQGKDLIVIGGEVVSIGVGRDLWEGTEVRTSGGSVYAGLHTVADVVPRNKDDIRDGLV